MINNNTLLGGRGIKRHRDHRQWLSILAYAFLLQWYFRPMCLQYLKNSGIYGSLPSILFIVYAYVALAVSLFAILLWGIRKYKFRDSFLILFFLWIALSGWINNGFSEFASSMASCFTQIGMICLIIHLFKVEPTKTAWALFVIFVVHFALNLITVAAFPTGLTHGINKAGFIYFFGGKNSILMWGILLLAVTIFMSNETGNKLWIKLAVVFSVVYAALAMYIDSASSTVCFAATALLLFLEYKSLLPKPLFAAPNYLILTVVVFFLIVVFNSANVFTDFLNMLNRTDSFSGRDALWVQGINYVFESPFFGCGDDIPFYLGNINANHAHSFYLTYAAEYGVPVSIFFLLDAWMVCTRVKKINNQYANMLVIPYCVLLFHSLFDVLNIGNLILIRTLIVYLTDVYQGTQVKEQRHYPNGFLRAEKTNEYNRSYRGSSTVC